MVVLARERRLEEVELTYILAFASGLPFSSYSMAEIRVKVNESELEASPVVLNKLIK